AHRGHYKDEDSYKECWSHIEFSISLARNRRHFVVYFCLHRGKSARKHCKLARAVSVRGEIQSHRAVRRKACRDTRAAENLRSAPKLSRPTLSLRSRFGRLH